MSTMKKRQVAAILFADIAGYSRLMEAYEIDTHRRLMALVSEVVEPAVAAEGGRIVKNTGDGFIACFTSVNRAITAANLIQQEAWEREADHPTECRIAFRMGLHYGNIFVEDRDIYGADVNLAARLQELSEPGGLLISGAAHEQLGSNLKLPSVDLGYVQLKNLTHSVRVFGVAASTDKGLPDPGSISRRSRGIPSIAVLPFSEYGVEHDENYFGDGLVFDIVSALASLPDFHVISRSSTLKYRGSEPDLRAVSRELGVRYVLCGNIRRRNSRLRLSAELADTETLRAIATYQGEEDAAELFALQDRLTEQVVQTLAPNIRMAELRRIERKRPENFDAYDYFLRGLDLIYRLDREEFEQARRMFQDAIRRDPEYAPPYAFTALWHSIYANQGWASDRRAESAKVADFSAAALLRDPNNVWALALSGQLRALLLHDFDTAFDLFDRALRASPNSAFAWSRSSPVFSYVGDGAEATRRAMQGLRLSPFDPNIFFTHCALGFAAYTEGDCERAVAWARRSFAENPTYTANLRFLIAALAATGQHEEARRFAEILCRLEPGFRVRRFIETYAYRDEPLRARFAEHLLLAGLPA
jgi:class 3 adenylate cyclase/tetratricopeptide (TPR) repeat protein